MPFRTTVCFLLSFRFVVKHHLNMMLPLSMHSSSSIIRRQHSPSKLFAAMCDLFYSIYVQSVIMEASEAVPRFCLFFACFFLSFPTPRGASLRILS